ncbi:HAMP domain-containing histidine kinase [Azospirillum sp. YIM DDC1]|uniref:histidine kinase n=1 Tax=Azospirillum aestuarii TaxID=2802052 RepID=A0ABS1HSU6_9PROT|nr:HAMP domain-containing sensor histidine kinase [Azospirillum aestuarii]MBK3772612.1 sensor histidine kinase [Azospirillum brasilense]MBK4717906.1 HAMP domain-containing histidine kinase [Azospirillum aestuarii]
MALLPIEAHGPDGGPDGARDGAELTKGGFSVAGFPGGRLRWLWHSLASRLALLTIVFLAVPVLIYDQFQRADTTTQTLLLQSAQRQGELIARALEPDLSRANRAALPQLGSILRRFADGNTRLKLLVRPRVLAGNNLMGSDGFYYVAAAPSVPTDDLDAERHQLLEQGVLDRLGASCAGNEPLALRLPRSSGGYEILTSVTPINTAFGCWALVTSHTAGGYLESSLGRPYWSTPVVQAAAMIYIVMAALVMAVLLGVWRNLHRFGDLARDIVSGGIGESGQGSFTNRNTVPELSGVAEDFDRLVDTLRESARSLRRAAEDNAHAYKTPIAVIRQSVEPLRRSLPAEDNRSQRALTMIEKSVDKLDGLVSFGRRMDEAAADLLVPPRRRVDLSDLVERMAGGYTSLLAERQLHMRSRIESGVVVRASEDILETVIENLVENAVSFSPPDGTVSVRLSRNGAWAELVVEDEGPGVDPANLPRIFERYFSQREPGRGMPEDAAAQNQAEATHFGIGLWIVRRNIEAFGGKVRAENRSTGGFRMTVTLAVA